MIALLAAAAVTVLTPHAVLTRYQAALAAVREPRVFTVEYTLEQAGTRTLEQTHRIFRSGPDERDETIAMNGVRLPRPTVRIYRGRRYRYTISALAPKPSAYVFAFAGARKSAKRVDYVFRTRPKHPGAFAVGQITIDGTSFLPNAIAFSTSGPKGRGIVTFGKAERYWVATGASASARDVEGIAHDRLTFNGWRFPASLPRTTFAAPRPLRTLPPAL